MRKTTIKRSEEREFEGETCISVVESSKTRTSEMKTLVNTSVEKSNEKGKNYCKM